MSQKRGLDYRIDRTVRRYEETRLMKTKRSDELEVIEEVFDRFTLEAVYELMRKRLIDKMHGVVKTGKEARIYSARSPEGTELAVKVYYTVTAESRQAMLKYIQDDYRFKRVKRTPKDLVYAWAQKEYRNLKEALASGVDVPQPFDVYRNVLVMQFIGRDDEPAPLLKEVSLRAPTRTYRRLLNQVKLLYVKANLVHGDLSEYNIMYWQDRCVIIDISQAVPTNHPLANELILRDVANLNRFFGHLGVKTVDSQAFVRGLSRGS